MSLGVLIVEDEREFREYLVEAIPWARYDLRVVGAVDDVTPARELLRTEVVDLVLLDITLQQGDGLTLVEECKSLQRAPRIIVITGHSEFETVRRALRLGVDDYLLKPFARQELLMSVLSNREHLLERLKEQRQQATLQEAMIHGWLHRLLRAESSREREHLLSLLDRHELHLPAPPRLLVCCALHPPDGGSPGDGDADRMELSGSNYRRWVDNVATMWKLATEQLDAITWPGLDDRVYLLLGGTEPSEVAWEARDTAQELAGQIRRRLPVAVRVGISAVDDGTFILISLLRQALDALAASTDREPVVPWIPELKVQATEHARGERKKARAGSTPAERRYELARRFIEEYHHDPTLDVQTVASHLGISTEYLRRIFRQMEARTCIEAITQRRMEHAKALLREELIPVAEVAARSGFRDPAYFARQFRRVLGVSPREYRLQ